MHHYFVAIKGYAHILQHPVFQMLIAAFGYLTGYDGKFEFEKPGQKFNETHYLGMRFVSIF